MSAQIDVRTTIMTAMIIVNNIDGKYLELFNEP